MGDLQVSQPLEVAQSEDLGLARGEARHRLPQPGLELPAAPQALRTGIGGVHEGLPDLVQIDLAAPLAPPHQVQRGVDRGPVQVAPRALREVRLLLSPQKTGENGLQNVLRVHGVAGDPVRGAINRPVMLPEQRFQGARGACERFLINCSLHASCPPFSFAHGYAPIRHFLQGTPDRMKNRGARPSSVPPTPMSVSKATPPPRRAERPPWHFRLAMTLIRRQIRGGYRLVDTARRLGWLNVVVPYTVGKGPALDVPLYRPENFMSDREALDYEAPAIALLAEEIGRRPAPVTLVDCGADIGLVSALLLDRCPNVTRVIAFEPNLEAFPILKGNIERLSPAGECHATALTDVAGTAG